MSRLSPKLDVIRALFAKSGNRCAFPGCTAGLINERNQFIAQVCHIEAAEEGGERYNPHQTDEERRSYANLMLLCYPHHVETDDVSAYPVDRLKQIKAVHESTFGQKIFKIDESLLYKITEEMEAFWEHAEQVHRAHLTNSDLAIEIDMKASFSDLAISAHHHIDDVLNLRDMLLGNEEQASMLIQALRQALVDHAVPSAHDEPQLYGPNNFEILNLGFTNTATRLRVLLVQMELRYLGEHLKLNPSDGLARGRIESLKAEFTGLAASAGYAD
jgi:hypothetical protein